MYSFALDLKPAQFLQEVPVSNSAVKQQHDIDLAFLPSFVIKHVYSALKTSIVPHFAAKYPTPPRS